jgi:hypothetical protein
LPIFGFSFHLQTFLLIFCPAFDRFFIAAFCCSYLARTDPADVARVESKTFIVTEERSESVPDVAEGVKGILGQWMSPDNAHLELSTRFPGCMAGELWQEWRERELFDL